MKLTCLILITLLTGTSIHYEKELAPEYDKAIKYLTKNKADFDHAFTNEPVQKKIMVSVVFPEIVRYSLIRDLIETKSLELTYVRKGTKFIDFSIGRFQMKPSFIESIEAEIKKSTNLQLKYQEVISYKDAEKSNIRKERVDRLKSLKWQIVYLKAFFDVVNKKYPFLQEKPVNYQIRFFATAYNHGYYADKNEIEQWMDAKTYPYGTGVTGEQYAYSRVSEYFYFNHYRSIFN